MQLLSSLIRKNTLSTPLQATAVAWEQLLAHKQEKNMVSCCSTACRLFVFWDQKLLDNSYVDELYRSEEISSSNHLHTQLQTVLVTGT